MVLLVFIAKNSECQENNLKLNPSVIDYVAAFKDTLASLSENSDNDFFRMHCNSILAVIHSKYSLNMADSTFLKNTYKAFINDQRSGQCSKHVNLSAKKEAINYFMGFPYRWSCFILLADPSKRLESGK